MSEQNSMSNLMHNIYVISKTSLSMLLTTTFTTANKKYTQKAMPSNSNYAVQSHSRLPLSVPIESPYATPYV